MSCVRFFVQVMTVYKGKVPPVAGESGNKSRAEQVFSWFKALATDEEVEIMKAKPPDMATRMEVATLLNGLILDQIEKGYSLLGVTKARLRSSELLLNSVNPQVRGANLDIDRRACQRFRHGDAPPQTTPHL